MEPPEIWVIHVLLGDGIATNEKAAKIIWACVKKRHIKSGARSKMFCLKCLTHQAGWTAKSSVMGLAATTGAGEGELRKAITGVASRLFEFVICDYFEEFVFSVRIASQRGRGSRRIENALTGNFVNAQNK